jgi:predicted nucleic acid-binding protein
VANKPPSIVALDTSVIVAGLLSWHAQHEEAAAELIALLSGPDKIVVPLHSLVEAYAVMTRLPPPNRLSPDNALALLEGSFRNSSTLIGLDGDEGWNLLSELSRQSIAGGTSYDALILACARKGGAQRLLTFNRRHFERLESSEIDIVSPGQQE